MTKAKIAKSLAVRSPSSAINAPTIGQPKVSKFRHLAASQHVTA